MAIMTWAAEIKPGYKRTEVGVLPEDWEAKQIRDVCSLINGRGFKPHEWQTIGLPIIRIQNLNGSEDFNYYPGPYNPKILIEHGQLLFAWSGSRGTSFGPHVWNGGRALLNYHTWKVVVSESRTNPHFLLHALRQLTGYIETKAHGASALVHVQKWEMEKFLIPIPSSLIEQQAIATALSDVDALITSLDKLIAKKQDIKQATMQELLTGKTRLPGFSGEWEIKKIKEVAPLQRGFDLPTSQLKEGIYPVVYSNGVLNHHSNFKVKAPGVVTGRSGTIGRVNYIENNYWPHNTSLWVTDFKGNFPKFIYYMYINLKLERFGTGSGVPTMNRNDVHTYQISLPSLLEQQAIATILSDMDAEIVALERRRDKTRTLKQGMMQELLTGKTRLYEHSGAGRAHHAESRGQSSQHATELSLSRQLGETPQ